MATSEESSVAQLNLTIEESSFGQPNIAAQAPEPDDEEKAIFKTGLFISLISIGGILNPPIITTLNKTHNLLFKLFHFTVWVCLAIGVWLILLSTILNRVPKSIIVAKPLTEIGWGLATITLGYGSSLVLMVSSSPWFALYIIFLIIRFM